MVFSDVDTLLGELKQGKMIIVMDDPGRENEGDFIMAAECVTPEAINFMATHGRGLVCLPMSSDRAKKLNLSLMVPGAKYDNLGTKFTNSIEASTGVTTGISAADRSHTIKEAIAPNATASDIVQPGHVFPIIAQDGGVLTRAGHTEAACDYARLAGFDPSGVIVEILNEDGTMARQDDLIKIAEKFDLKMGTIADLIKYRMLHEKTVSCIHEKNIETKYGNFTAKWFQDLLDNQVHCVLQKGEINPEINSEINSEKALAVRVYYPDPLIDILNLKNIKDESYVGLEDAMSYMQNEGSGVIIILDRSYSGKLLLDNIKSLDKNSSVVNRPKSEDTVKTVGAGSRILRELGAKKLKVLGAPLNYAGLDGFGLEVVSHVDLKSGPQK